MTPSEKDLLARAVGRVMEDFPAQPAAPGVRQWMMFLQPYTMRMGAVVTAVAIVFVLSGGTAVAAAEEALPGDLLYAIKINVNEKFRDNWAINEEAKAQWEVKKTERRLAEIQRLAQKSKLKGQVLVEATEQYEGQMERAVERIKKLEKQGDREHARDLEKQLVEIKQDHEVNIEILVNENNNGGRDTENEQRIRRFIEKLEEPVNPPPESNPAPRTPSNTTEININLIATTTISTSVSTTGLIPSPRQRMEDEDDGRLLERKTNQQLEVNKERQNKTVTNRIRLL